MNMKLMPDMNATAPKFELSLPRQVQRILPACVACILLLVFYSHSTSFNSIATNALSYATSSATIPHFPKKIWQTWKVDPLVFEERDLNCARTWTAKNPHHRYEVLTDQNDMMYVETNFGPEGFNRPDIVDTYRALTAKIIKADLLRYLVMYVEGGVYADIDVEALRPIERFVPARYEEKDIEMVIGVEIDQPEYKDHPILGQKSMSFCQWTFMTKPHLPVMMALVDNIISWLNKLAHEQNKPISELELDFDAVISGTGPSAFTEAILSHMRERSGREVTWDMFHNLEESRLVGGVLVLTVEAFAAGQGHSDSGNHDSRNALIKHHYHASGWPTTHPRKNHPMYGEVEQCNWEAECVMAWDANTKAFDALPAEEQRKLIAIKETKGVKEAKEAATAFDTLSQMGKLGSPPPPAEGEKAEEHPPR